MAKLYRRSIIACLLLSHQLIITPQQSQFDFLRSGLLEHRTWRIGIGIDRGDARPKDTGLFKPDDFAIVAKEGNMIDVHRCQDGKIRVQDIDSIQPPTQANLQHPVVEARTGKGHESGKGSEFEIGERDVSA